MPTDRCVRLCSEAPYDSLSLIREVAQDERLLTFIGHMDGGAPCRVAMVSTSGMLQISRLPNEGYAVRARRANVLCLK